MNYSASIQNSSNNHQVRLKVGDKQHFISIEPKPTGGSSVSASELLMLALAACHCNDIHREAAASEGVIRELIKHTDTVVEIHKTLRVQTPVKLEIEAGPA